LAPVELSAVCFRHKNKDKLALIRRVLARRQVCISSNTIRDRFALRACFVNHRTREADVRSIITEVSSAARELNA
jgi:aromatic-L-amino-acid/L-tryptophan decarboxylase